jgi:hypothetical protein
MVRVKVAGVNPFPTVEPAPLRSVTLYPVMVPPSAFWDLTVNVDVAPVTTLNTLESVFPLELAAATEWGPAVDEADTANVAEKVPVEVVVTVAGLVVTAEPSNVILTVDEAPKLEPVTVTVVPVAPEAGLDLIDAAGVTVKVALALVVPLEATTV